jgi:hypothetical protein
VLRRFYDAVIRPAYFHGLKFLRLVFTPLAFAGALSRIGGEAFGLSGTLQVVVVAVGLLLGLCFWAAEYVGESPGKG